MRLKILGGPHGAALWGVWKVNSSKQIREGNRNSNSFWVSGKVTISPSGIFCIGIQGELDAWNHVPGTDRDPKKPLNFGLKREREMGLLWSERERERRKCLVFIVLLHLLLIQLPGHPVVMAPQALNRRALNSDQKIVISLSLPLTCLLALERKCPFFFSPYFAEGLHAFYYILSGTFLLYGHHQINFCLLHV